MKKLILAIMLIPLNCIAESLPTGCYVADFDPFKCYAPIDGFLVWPLSTNQSLLTSSFGSAVAFIISRSSELEIGRNNAVADLLTCQNNYNNLNNNFNTNISDYNGLVDQYNSQLNTVKKRDLLIKKLRKACGSKCLRIK